MNTPSRLARISQLSEDTRHGLDASELTPDELAALLARAGDRVLVMDAECQLHKHSPGGDGPPPTEDPAVPDGDRAALRAAIQSCLEDGRTREVGYRVEHPDDERHCTARVQPTGHHAVLLTIRDMTALSTWRGTDAIISNLASRLTNSAPSEIDATIRDGLAEVGACCQASRASLYLFTDEQAQLVNAYHWQGATLAIASAVSHGDRLPSRQLTGLLQRLRRGDVVLEDGTERSDGDDEHKRILADRGTCAFAAAPVFHSAELQGFLWADDMDGPHRWSTEQLHLLARAADLFATALQRRHSEQRLFRLAYYDQLTGLPNRLLLRTRLQTQLRTRETPFALVLIDLDDASTLNDLLGHDVGDLLLRTLSDRLRTFATDGETVARWGGDAFMLTVPLDGDDLASAAERLAAVRRSLAAPMVVDGHELRVSSCMGMACHPRHTSNVDEMIRFAELALGRARSQGRDSLVVFDVDMKRRAAHRNRIEHRLRHAVETEAFDLHYQPQFSAVTGQLVGAEALIRWYDPELGLVPPNRFIDMAEDTGMIVAIGDWLAGRACRDLAEWRRAGLHVPCVAVNVSGQQLLDDHLPTTLERALSQHHLPPSAVELEITESALMEQQDVSLPLLRQLRELGIGIAMDDFGTGYSSLSQIKHLPLSKLKIDQSFIQDIFRNPDDRAIVAAIIAMAQQLELKVVAEGVETREQLLYLRRQGCDIVQGHFHGRAAAPATFLRRLQRTGIGETGA